MNDELFDKLIRDAVHDYADPSDQGNWEALSARMAHKSVALRRRRLLWACTAAAASLLLFFGLFPLFTPDPATEIPTIAVVPPSLVNEAQPDPQVIHPIDIQPFLLGAAADITPEAPAELQPAVQEEVYTTPAQEEPAQEAVFQEMTPQVDSTPTNNHATTNRSNFIPPEPVKRDRQFRKWVTAANMSYQGAINGNYLFTPSTYTTKFETPLALAGSDLNEMGVPEYISQEITSSDVNVFSTHYSTPISAGINVQKEFNRWLSVGASLTYTLLRGQYEVITADKSYVVNQNTHYIGIPLSVYFHAINNSFLSVYVVAGGAIDKAVADQYDYTLNNITSRSTSSVQGFQYSVFGGLGIEYKCTDLLGIYVEPAVSHYFDNDQPKSIRTIQPTQFKVEVGVRFRI